MPKPKTQAAFADGSADDTETAFYQALRDADIDRLMACWADDDEIICVHPGGPRVVGARAIRATFESIFANGSIRAWPEQVRRVEAMSCVVHNVLERVEVITESGPAQAYVLATNVYFKTVRGWRMVAHHASPGYESAEQEISEVPQVLH